MRPDVKQRVLVTGGTGHLGRELIPRCREHGWTVRIMSRRPAPAVVYRLDWATADLATGAGLDAAVEGVDAIAHLASLPYRGRGTDRVDVEGTARLLSAAGRAGVSHVVYSSIVGVDAIPWPYFRKKLAAEHHVRDGSVPWSIVRATQFFPLVDRFLEAAARLPVLLAPTDVPGRPVDPRDVAERIARQIARARARGSRITPVPRRSASASWPANGSRHGDDASASCTFRSRGVSVARSAPARPCRSTPRAARGRGAHGSRSGPGNRGSSPGASPARAAAEIGPRASARGTLGLPQERARGRLRPRLSRWTNSRRLPRADGASATRARRKQGGRAHAFHSSPQRGHETPGSEGSPLHWGTPVVFVVLVYGRRFGSAAGAAVQTSQLSACSRTKLSDELDNRFGSLVGRSGVEWRLWVVLDRELDRLRHVVAGDQLREAQRHVDTRRDSRGGDDLALLDDALERGLGAERAQLIEEQPMRSRAQALEDTGGAQQQGTSTDRGRVARGLMCLLDPRDKLVMGLVTGPASSWDDDELGLRNLAQAALGGQRQGTRVGALGPRLSGDEEDFGAWQAAEHLVRADRV
jgi:uncharacterized protein YbjT (DUF2867 family)